MQHFAFHSKVKEMLHTCIMTITSKLSNYYLFYNCVEVYVLQVQVYIQKVVLSNWKSLCQNLWFCFGKTAEKLYNHVIGHLWYVNILTWLQGFQDKIAIFEISFNVPHSQKRLGYKENTTKYRSLPGKPWSHAEILIYWRSQTHWWQFALPLKIHLGGAVASCTYG